VIRTAAGVIAVFVVFVQGSPAFADDGDKKLFTFKDARITESSGLAVSPTRDGVFYTHNDSSAAPTFYAVGSDGRTRATYRLQGAQARDWEAMAASKDPATGRGVLWFADIGDNLDGAWPDVSVYKVMEPETLRDATLPAVRYRFRYADGARNAEGIMVNPVTGRLFVVSKEFSGSVYQAPKKLRSDRVNVLRKVGTAPIMATDAAYAPDGSSYVIRTYFSATVFRPSGESIGRVSMPELKQAESIAYTRDGKNLLTGSEGVRSPVYQVALPAAALPAAGPSSSPTHRSKATVSPSARPVAAAKGLSARDVLIWLAAAAGASGIIAAIARRTR
jgi:DNA-binding beta-propeller fold protein YncE